MMQKVQQILSQRLRELALSLENSCFLDAVVEVFGEGSVEHEADQ